MYRPQPQRNLRLFVWLWVLWIALVLCGYLLWMIYTRSQEERGLSRLFRDLLEPGESAMVALILAPIGIILAAVHYSVLRGLPATGKKRFFGREAATVWVVSLVLAGIPGWVIYRAYREAELHAACLQWELDAELGKLMAAGDVETAVRRMEQGCERFREAKAKLGERFYNLSLNYGFSFLFVTLRKEKACLEQNAPGGVLDFLYLVKYDGYGDKTIEIGEYGAWRPLAEEMSRSDTPIIKILGFHLLEDDANFAEAVYVEVDAGNNSLEPLAEYAAKHADPDAVRAAAWLKKLGASPPGP